MYCLHPIDAIVHNHVSQCNEMCSSMMMMMMMMMIVVVVVMVMMVVMMVFRLAFVETERGEI